MKIMKPSQKDFYRDILLTPLATFRILGS
jgi:hypothetical protein